MTFDVKGYVCVPGKYCVEMTSAQVIIFFDRLYRSYLQFNGLALRDLLCHRN